MINSQFIEVGIGLVFVFLLLSIMVSGINEAIVSLLDHRGKQLKDAIFIALNDPSNKNWTDLMYKHPLIDSLKKSEKKLPSYIDSSIFAKTLVEIITQENNNSESSSNNNIDKDFSPIGKFISGLNTLQPSDSKTLFLSFVNDANGDYEKLKTNIESWYNSYMDRVSGWYKRKTKKILVVIGFILAVLMNVDTIKVSTRLWENTVLRESIANVAESYVNNKDSLSLKNDSTFTTDVKKIKDGYNQLNMLNLPIGWYISEVEQKNIPSKEESFIKHYFSVVKTYWNQIELYTLLGWIFTAIAVSFGSPIWFDLLNKLINLRQTVKNKSNKN